VCGLEVTGVPSILTVIRSVTDSVRILPTLDLSCAENSAWYWN
jgi:hypothetical protein